MLFRRSFAIAILLLLASAASAAEPLTQKCNTGWEAPAIAVRLADDARYAALVALVNDPTRDPDAYARLRQPLATQPVIERWLALHYGFDLLVDTDEVAQAIASDPVLASRGVISVESDHFDTCFAALPAAGHVTITEYHNRILDHYFLSSSAAENSIIESGGAGPGWERTGEAFTTNTMDSCRGVLPVFRFYGSGLNSHFFTVDSEECGAVLNSDPGWIFEGNAFGARMPVDGACPAGMVTVYRLYNDRARFLDSNHRYVVRPELYADMMARGWVGEGVAMCLPQFQ
jgi:uncharacterized protein DUF5648